MLNNMGIELLEEEEFEYALQEDFKSAIKHGILGDTSKYVSEEGINVKFNNAGYESNLK